MSSEDIQRLLRQASADEPEILRELVAAIERAGHVEATPPLIALRRLLDMITDIASRDLPDGWTLQWGQLLEIRPELTAHHIRWSLREHTPRGFRPKSISIKMPVEDLRPGRVGHWGGVLKVRVDDAIAQRRERAKWRVVHGARASVLGQLRDDSIGGDLVLQDLVHRLDHTRVYWPAYEGDDFSQAQITQGGPIRVFPASLEGIRMTPEIDDESTDPAALPS